MSPAPDSPILPPPGEHDAAQLALEPALGPYVAPMGDGAAAVADEALARRAKAMACTLPLHRLDANRGRVRDGAFAAYTVVELAFVAIDTVTVQMDFDRGAAHDAVIDAVVPYAKLQAPDRDAAEHRAVAKWVLDELIGTASNREFTVEYSDFGAEYTRRTFPFQLLVERQAPDGSVYLRATDAAINVLVGALDTDVESAQAAAEAKLENLVRRRRLDEAQHAARAALYRTVQLGEQLRQDLAATKRNLASVDWTGEVSPRLDGALTHIAERLEVERRIVVNIREARDETDKPNLRRQASTLLDLLDDCQNRHIVLQRKLMEARQVFLAEQQRQVFAPPASVRLRDIASELLIPVLALPVAGAEPRVVHFFERVLGPRTERLGRLTGMVRALLAPPRERDELGGEVAEPELRDVSPAEAFPPEVRAAAASVLDAVDSEPRRLSELLATALEDSPVTAHLVALLVLHAYSPAVESHLRAGDESPVLVAYSDATELPAVLRRGGEAFARVFGNGRGQPQTGEQPAAFFGDDLLVVRLDVVAAAHLAKAAA
jgi:hypothetical protein